MTAWIVAVVAALLAALIQGVVFRKYERHARTKEQCFRFHELRDTLQALALERKIDTCSRSYQMLFGIINFAIQNAGAAKLSDMLTISRTMKRNMESNAFQELRDSLKSYPPEVQSLASGVFTTFAQMLVANDDITYWLFMVLERLTAVINLTALYSLKYAMRLLSPKRAEVVHEATRYRRLGRILAHSH